MSENCPISENDIARHVRKALSDYFKDLDGEEPSVAIYDMVLCCVEKPMLETVLQHAGAIRPAPPSCSVSTATPCARRCNCTESCRSG